MEQLPLFVLDCFERGDLAGIKALIEERRILQERIRLLKKFIEKWENPDFYSVLGVTKPEDDKARNILS
ncbi:hypothetical protein [Effusibacillus lacus]|nr:hypothetical protein [Effusibacillus lacus]